MLTKRQKIIFEFVRKFIERKGYSPTFEEIKKHFGLSSVSTVHHHIRKLKEEGLIRKKQNEPRSILVEENHSKELVDISLVGSIAAGQPIEAIELPGTIKVPQSQLAKTGQHYALKVTGDSMIGEGIYDGDIVLIRKQSVADNGTTVVALINNNEVTLKKIYKEKGQFRLQPANPDIKPIFTKDLTIQGKVISVIRTYDDDNNLVEKENLGKKLNIPFQKKCTCPSNHINCLQAKQWMKNQIAIWEFSYEKRDIRDKNIHPAVFPIGLPSKCIELFTHKGELVLDPFSGIGTTLLAAKDLDRNAVGFDLSDKYTKFTKTRLSQTPLFSSSKQIAITDDSINISNYLEKNSVALVVTSPPYANMLNRPRKNKSMRGSTRVNEHYQKVQQYSNNPRDLGTMEPRKFAEALGEIYAKILPLIKPRGHCVINITDLWWENKRYPLHLYIIEALEKVGYELRNTIIWDRRNLVNNIGIFGWPSNYITLGTTMEYILDFWRPAK